MRKQAISEIGSSYRGLLDGAEQASVDLFSMMFRPRLPLAGVMEPYTSRQRTLDNDPILVVLLVCNKTEMIGANATADVADVVDLQTFWDSSAR
jgi:hypothetical protein